MADVWTAGRDQPRLRRPRALRHRQDARRRRRPVDERRPGRQPQQRHAAGLGNRADGLRTQAAQPDGARRRNGPRNGRKLVGRGARRPERRRLRGRAVEPGHRPVADASRGVGHAPVPLDRAAAARRPRASSGGGICGTCDQVGYLGKNAQVFSPPYLFQADGTSRRGRRSTPPLRPRATARRWTSRRRTRRRSTRSRSCGWAPSRTPNNMEQRYVPLTFTAGRNEPHRHRTGQREHRASGLLHALHHRHQRRAVRCPHGQRPGELAADA